MGILLSCAEMNQFIAVRLPILLAMSRVSNLPSIWANCLAGWELGGAHTGLKLLLLLLGVSSLYLGGCFLNDAFDAEQDRRRRPTRPLPSGKISPELVWRIGFGLLILGVLLLVPCSTLSGVGAVLLVVFILLFNATHQFLTASPWLLGLCRFWIYFIAGAAGAKGLNGWSIYAGLALMIYTAGAGHIARWENIRGTTPRWPLGLLAIPLILAFIMNTGYSLIIAGLVSVVLVFWTGRSVMNIVLGGESSPARVAANLVAGMAWVDWLAVAPDVPIWLHLVFPLLFGLTKWLQVAGDTLMQKGTS
jgi:hypothetical protein